MDSTKNLSQAFLAKADHYIKGLETQQVRLNDQLDNVLNQSDSSKKSANNQDKTTRDSDKLANLHSANIKFDNKADSINSKIQPADKLANQIEQNDALKDLTLEIMVEEFLEALYSDAGEQLNNPNDTNTGISKSELKARLENLTKNKLSNFKTNKNNFRTNEELLLEKPAFPSELDAFKNMKDLDNLDKSSDLKKTNLQENYKNKNPYKMLQSPLADLSHEDYLKIFEDIIKEQS
jgi:hypothetical protein